MLVALAACTSAAGPPPTDDAGVPMIVQPDESDDTDACAAAFALGDERYVTSCGAARPELVTAEVLGTGSYQGRPSEVRRIEGIEPSVMVALRRDAGVCADGDTVLSPWAMAFHVEAGDTSAAVCQVTVDAHRERNRCP